jgi:Bifunctional DNA primase/polymerase, N-terminal
VSDHNRDCALRLAEAGLAVFPAGPDKKARVKWRDASTTDAQTIKAWWTQWPNSLPAIDLAKCGLLVLDGDRHGGPDGRAALKQLLLSQRGEYDGSATPAALTPGDGAHVYFRQNGRAFGNSRGELPDGIDVRGQGGYVICPYAELPDGRRYETVKGMADLIAAFKSGTVPPIPSGIAKLLEKPARKEPPPELQSATNRSTSSREEVRRSRT